MANQLIDISRKICLDGSKVEELFVILYLRLIIIIKIIIVQRKF